MDMDPRQHGVEDLYDEEHGRVVAASPSSKCEQDKLKNKPRRFPTMPCISHVDQHRGRLTSKFNQASNLGFNAMVSRPVGRKEMMDDPEARASMQKGWKGQRDAGVYDICL